MTGSGMREKLSKRWQSLTIKEKIICFTGSMFMVLIVSLLFDVWVAGVSMVEMGNILKDNARSSELVQALEEETQAFAVYMKTSNDENLEALSRAIKKSEQAVGNLSFDYRAVGAKRFGQAWSIQNSYEVYREKRDRMLAMDAENPGYIDSLYRVYEMQGYLLNYANALMIDIIEDGNEIYQKKVPGLVWAPVIVFVVLVFLCIGLIEMSKLMNYSLIDPIMKLVQGSKKIAANEFFTEDIQVENRDELGELVSTFNKMKYATGQYIQALEQTRVTLDKLHEEEMAKLEMEKRLELMRLELLKNQIHPHFLFNTLNVIGGMANLEDAATTEKMITALSALFRYNLKTTDAEVMLSQELKVMQDYMYLQQMRFGSRIRFEVTCNVNKDAVLVPVFTFQPLVENAIIHGLSKKEAGGVIRVRIWKDDAYLHITIGDNGVGLDSEELEILREKLKRQDDTVEGIGLGNIYKRIRAMYPESSFEIYSRKDVGTVIRIDIPS